MGTLWGNAALVVIVSMLASALRIAAAEKAPRRRAATPEDELSKLENDWAAAVATNDPDRIGRFFSNDFLFVGAGGVLQNRKQHLDDFRSGRLKIDSVKLEASTVHVYETVAVVSNRCVVKGVLVGQDITGDYQFTDMWLRKDGRWIAVARQQTRVRAPVPAT